MGVRSVQAFSDLSGEDPVSKRLPVSAFISLVIMVS